MNIKTEEFRRADNLGFAYVYTKTLEPGDEIYLKMPRVTPNKRGVNDIGYMMDAGITLSATFAEDLRSDDTLWQDIGPYYSINKTVSFLKIQNSGNTPGKINIRAILN